MRLSKLAGRRRPRTPIVELPRPAANATPRAGRGLTPAASGSDLARLVERAGLQVDRWHSPDLLGQLAAGAWAGVVCNGVEGDGPAAVQRLWATRHAQALAAGLCAAAAAGGATQVVVAADARDARAYRRALKAGAAADAASAVVRPLRPQYPLGHPTALLHALFGLRLPPTRLPTAAGWLVLDAVAAVRLGQAVRGEDSDALPVGVVDGAGGVASVVVAWRGMTIGDVAATAGAGRDVGLLAGDPRRRTPADAAAGVGPGELVYHVAADAPAAAPRPCVRCGWCVEACPVALHPAALLEAAQRRDAPAARAWAASACIECGVCDQACPSDLPLLTAARAAKVLLG